MQEEGDELLQDLDLPFCVKLKSSMKEAGSFLPLSVGVNCSLASFLLKLLSLLGPFFTPLPVPRTDSYSCLWFLNTHTHARTEYSKYSTSMKLSSPLPGDKLLYENGPQPSCLQVFPALLLRLCLVLLMLNYPIHLALIYKTDSIHQFYKPL